MTSPHLHHPSCSARWGGLCTVCPPEKPAAPHVTDISCGNCGDTFLILGETPEKRAEALAAWSGCGCKVPLHPTTAAEIARAARWHEAIEGGAA